MKEIKDYNLRLAALNGDSRALGQLIENHRDFIYNIVWRMVLNTEDAEDITQDIIIKIITNLAKFKGESKFSTWIYRITYNHVINLPKTKAEKIITGFEHYGKSLDDCKDEPYPDVNQVPTPEDEMVVKEALLGCTSGMLLCLDREQRFIFILGELFAIESHTGAEILNISAENYRKRLSRARKQLFNFMDNKCGLVNKSNPCRCNKKTKAFIKRGWVNPKDLKFNNHFQKLIKEVADKKHPIIWDIMEQKYAEIYQGHPYQEKAIIKKRIEKVLASGDFKKAFNLSGLGA